MGTGCTILTVKLPRKPTLPRRGSPDWGVLSHLLHGQLKASRETRGMPTTVWP